ncbi:MAG: hypothetical protein B6230_06795 [Desulfobacteraceae bacterium 4572_89]|nr:MAG: hypothetical protein B6230_06795 [Desulfobacteraceae bacterium 4572_89]
MCILPGQAETKQNFQFSYPNNTKIRDKRLKSAPFCISGQRRLAGSRYYDHYALYRELCKPPDTPKSVKPLYRLKNKLTLQKIRRSWVKYIFTQQNQSSIKNN